MPPLNRVSRPPHASQDSVISLAPFRARRATNTMVSYTVIISAAIEQIVTVRAGGLVELRSPELHEGDQAQVTVVVVKPVSGAQDAVATSGWRRYAGAINGADIRAGDNQQIDADLAAEYGDGTKVEP